MSAVTLAILASILWGIGTVLQKVGITRSFPKITLSRFFREVFGVFRTLILNWVWLIGTCFMLGGAAFFATALGEGDLSVIQPLVALTGAITASIGVLVLHEKISRLELAGILTILVGVVLVGAASGEPSSTPPGDCAMFLFILLAFALSFAAFGLKRLGFSPEFTLSFSAGILFGLANPLAKLLTQHVILDVGAPFSLTRPEVYLSLAADYPLYVVIVCNVFATIFMQTALAGGRASIISPLVTIVSTVLPILAAITLFGEAVNTLQVLGILVVVAGTAMLTGKIPATALVAKSKP